MAGLFLRAAFPLVVVLFANPAFAGPRDWPDREVERPIVAVPMLVEVDLEYSETQAARAFGSDNGIEPTKPGQPTFVRGLTVNARYGLFAGFEASLAVPFVLRREVDVLTSAPAGSGVGRVRLGSRYQLTAAKKLWVSGGAELLLPTTDPSLRPDPIATDGTPLRDNLAVSLDVTARRSFGAVAAVSLRVANLYTFANADDVDAQRAPAPAWGLALAGDVQAGPRASVGVALSFDRASRTEIGGEAVPDSDGHTLALAPRLGFHLSQNFDLSVGASTALIGKNAPRSFLWTLGFTGRF